MPIKKITVDSEKIESIIDALWEYYHNIDDTQYYHYSVEGLKNKLDEIRSRIYYLEALQYEIEEQENETSQSDVGGTS